MPYLTDAREIRAIVAGYTQATTLWIDTEVADYKSRNPRLSLIQVLDDPDDMSGDRVYLLDVLDQPDLVANFVEKIMVSTNIEKVFHNASFDVKLLGNKQAKNITCTLEIAKKIPYHLLPVQNYQLQSLATLLCNFNNIDKQEQSSNWGRRPLSEEQIEYAYLDCIYLAQIHRRLLDLQIESNPDPATVDITAINSRFSQIEEQWKLLNSEYEHLQEQLKKAMQAQNISETSTYKLTSHQRKVVKVQFSELSNLVQNQDISLDFPVTLTQKLQKDLGENLEQLSVDIEENTYLRLTLKNQDDS
ncbi:3'-5' exonuclease [Trichormus variabilis ATCC 29413]|uniref:3'-5' exonuclease n=2 Tax=Anabaena variabilis TaxID=264691 RepID=Q3MFE4_TRIV2|nr:MULTISPECIES: ribonuclease D [Nostocaceae]ABA20292.1 3'-5' exonuclease [Trichormus variabilis ATCC 29413]MBC1212730.1 ribonuclease D [Trichormus variabilis ARAD]MBC1257111.1 ribonuclease D [Trichormus variabilis V5]MBC1265831.1 ribonuclease D [Trichormus variabilis FSR]MBC1300642.1 ribonuclease D [Trichormus variabilis N2B]